MSQQRLQPPVQYEWAAVGFVLLVLVILLAMLWVRFVVRPRLARQARRDTDDDFPGGRAHDPARAKQLDRSVAAARLTDRVSRVIGIAWLALASSRV